MSIEGASVSPVAAPPARIAPLAVLPVFLSLAGKTAIVAGGGRGAVWKAELLAAAGAEVRVVARAPSVEMEMLAGGSRDTVVLVRRHWLAGDLAGAAVAIAEAEDADEGRAFHAAARAAGVPCNVIDMPECCDFQFGTVIGRSPVVVGVSTAGMAPVLAQAIRRRIEAILPDALGRWAESAGRLRARVTRAIPDSLGRRLFWSRFVESAFAGRPAAGPDAGLEDQLKHHAEAPGGSVTLVGAGPGSVDFLTFGAVRALQSADVILFDALVQPEVLDLARREAERVDVGKRAGRHSCRQVDIIDRMIALARDGKRVVRLKSGDPMVFGRAGEEIDALEAAGIAVDVVPGVTAAFALAAKLNVSLTDRRMARAVTFVTGHGRDGGGLPRDVDWTRLADPGATLIAYMAGRTAGDLAARLVAAGLDPDTPAVAAAGLGTERERISSGSLESLAAVVATVQSSEPVIIGIGSVFRRAETADNHGSLRGLMSRAIPIAE